MKCIQRAIAGAQSISASQRVTDDVVKYEREDQAADDRPPQRIKRILHDRSPDDPGRRPAGHIVCPKRARKQEAQTRAQRLRSIRACAPPRAKRMLTVSPGESASASTTMAPSLRSTML